MSSYFATSATNSTPTFSSAGRPVGKRSSSTHWRNGSHATGTASIRPKVGGASARSRSEVAGVMQSTMELGKATFAATQSASAGSERRARPVTVCAQTWPFSGRLSQDITVKGGTPASRRCRRAFRIMPNTVAGASGLAASAAMSGCAVARPPVVAST